MVSQSSTHPDHHSAAADRLSTTLKAEAAAADDFDNAIAAAAVAVPLANAHAASRTSPSLAVAPPVTTLFGRTVKPRHVAFMIT